MACSSCATNRGNSLPLGCNNNGACGNGGCNKLNVFDWLSNMALPSGQPAYPFAEVRFKNGRKELFKVPSGVSLRVGDAVAVEATSGHDIGVVSMTGEMVKLQMKRLQVKTDGLTKQVYRKASQNDIDKWQLAVAKEQDTMMRARSMAMELKLQMKISDVEYQGDGSKVTFFYTAEDRVDFRELIKRYAEAFRVRIEMRQIGYRQEASRLGGIGSCGRELCCSTWLRDFRAVNTSAARYQQLALNPQKLAGQCGKLKCCLNYELDTYLDALKGFPENYNTLEDADGKVHHQKTDIFKRLIWFTHQKEPSQFFSLTPEQVKLVQQMLAKGEKPASLPKWSKPQLAEAIIEPDYENVVGQDSLTRFDKRKKKNKTKGRKAVSHRSEKNSPKP